MRFATHFSIGDMVIIVWPLYLWVCCELLGIFQYYKKKVNSLTSGTSLSFIWVNCQLKLMSRPLVSQWLPKAQAPSRPGLLFCGGWFSPGSYLFCWLLLLLFTGPHHAEPSLLYHLTLWIPVGDSGGKTHATALGTCTPLCGLFNAVDA